MVTLPAEAVYRSHREEQLDGCASTVMAAIVPADPSRVTISVMMIGTMVSTSRIGEGVTVIMLVAITVVLDGPDVVVLVADAAGPGASEAGGGGDEKPSAAEFSSALLDMMVSHST